MASHLPPLNALRGFESAARHLSFTHAANELNVTQAAVSHQVKALEQDLGVPLFRRLTRKLALTEEGRVLATAVADAFARIGETAQYLRSDSRQSVLTVSLTQSIGVKWLGARLGRFWQQHPEIELRLHHSWHLVDFDREDVDMAIRWGVGDWPGLTSHLLKSADVTPLFSPKLLSGDKPIRSPADLRHHTLLHDAGYDDWPRWLAAAGAPEVDAGRGPTFDSHNVLLEAAIAGHGVALGSTVLLADDIAAGRLVAPFDLNVQLDAAYHIVYPPRAADLPKVVAFRDFLLEEAARDEAARELTQAG